MDILSQLWSGQVSPIEQPLEKDGTFHISLCRAIEIADQLESSMNSQQKQLFAAYSDEKTTMLGIAQEEAFACGFRLGIQLLLAGMEK